MLAIYRRHQSPCKYTLRRFRNCKCPIWVQQGSLRGEYVRRSLDLRSWEAASDLVRGWEASGEVGVVKPEVPAVAEAVTKFMDDAKARHLATETIRKYQNLLERRFVAWCESKGYRLLKQIDVGAMREFRTTWDDGPVYSTKNLERMRAFFRRRRNSWLPIIRVQPRRLLSLFINGSLYHGLLGGEINCYRDGDEDRGACLHHASRNTEAE